MAAEIRTTDQKARVTLPKAFANATVIVEQIGEGEIRIRKARVVPEDEFRFPEETPVVLANRERDAFLSALDHPPPANEALRRALAKHRKRHG